MSGLAPTSGVLCHFTSLPSSFGMGGFGINARGFVDFLASHNQSVWQHLPLTPPDKHSCPYSGVSGGMLNTLLIDPVELCAKYGVQSDMLRLVPHFSPHNINIQKAVEWKQTALSEIVQKLGYLREDQDFQAYRQAGGLELQGFAEFQVLSRRFQRPWWEWSQEYMRRDPGIMEAVRADLRDEIDEQIMLQFVVEGQLADLHKYALKRGVSLFGDVPLYVQLNSADVWLHPELFQLDADLSPTCLSGCPPDAFSRTGQFWKNPLYAWEAHEQQGFSWWINRIRKAALYSDYIRLDHFRGLVQYWSVAADAENAMHGQWVDVPTDAFLKAILAAYTDVDFIAEDLGVITPDVKDAMKRFNLPGLRVAQFGFDNEEDWQANPHLPHNVGQDVMATTGTHDNNTTLGWLGEMNVPRGRRIRQYCEDGVKRLFGAGSPLDDQPQAAGYAERILYAMIDHVMASSAQLVIFPIQDVLGLGESYRMNTPNTVNTLNWTMRVPEGTLDREHPWLREMTLMHGRAPKSRM